MTREEAKEVFLNRGYVNGFFDGDKWRQSVIIISELLEQESVLDKIRSEIEQERVGYPPSADYYKAITKCLSIIDENKPESDALENQPKTAKWIKHDTGHSVYFDCSLCHCMAPSINKTLWKLSNYCPDCGAKMGNAVEVLNRGNCLMCGKEITNGDSIFICNDCFVSYINYIHPIGSED